MPHIPLAVWITMGVNIGAAVVNISHSLLLRRKAKRWEHGFGQLLGFVVMIADAPAGIFPPSLQQAAKEAIPSFTQYTVTWQHRPSASERVH